MISREKIKLWLSDNYNLALLGIILFAIGIRLYYFFITSGQPIWWDEAEYMSTAKHWAFNTPYLLNPQRPPLFQLLSALSFMIGLGENFIRICFVVIPSCILVYTVYLLGNTMYNKKIGLIAALLTAVSWTLLFWTARLQPDFASMMFQVLAIYFMWKYWKESQSSQPQTKPQTKLHTKLIIYAGICAALGFYFKVSALLVPMIFIVFILIKDRFSALKNKDYYYFAAAFLITLLPYFIFSFIVFGDPLAFRQGYIDAPTDFPIGWYNINFYYSLTEGLLFYLFILGIIISAKFLLYADILVKEKEKCFNADLFSILSLLVISAFYIFYMRNTDDRWVFLWLPFIFFLVGTFIVKIFDVIKKYSRVAAFTVVFLLLTSCVYFQVNHANNIIINKKDTYLQVKQAGEWIKENYPVETKVLTMSYPQTVYYSERNISTYSTIKDGKEFDEYIFANKPDLFIVSVFERQVPWVNDWLQTNQNTTIPVKVYFYDTAQKQPVLIIYQLQQNT